MKKRSLWSRVLTLLLVVCMLMNDQSTSLFVEAVSAAALQPGEEDTLQPGNGETSEENQGGGEEQEQENSGQEQAPEQQQEQEQQQPDEQQPQEQQTPGEQEGEETQPVQENTEAAEGENGQETVPESQPLTARMMEARNARAAYNSIDELAQAYYGDENSSTYRREPSISIQRTDSLGNEIKAGDVLSFHISYTFPGAPLYEFGNQAEAIFDSYDNSTIILKLPEGLRAIDDQTALLPNISRIDANEDTAGTDNEGYWIYTYTLSNTSITAGSGHNYAFDINVQVTENGLRGIGEEFRFDYEDLLSIYTEFTVLDKSDGNRVVGNYKQTNPTASTLPSIKTKSDDSWTVKKSLKEGTEGIVVDENKKTVTLRYDLQIGLEGSNGEILTESSAYGVNGRVPFTSIQLSEDLTVNDREGKPLTPTSVTLIPQFATDQIADEGLSMEEGALYAIPVDTCGANKLTGTVDASAPYYSEYIVEAVYDYAPFIADYNDENQENLNVTNEAILQYQLKGSEAVVEKKVETTDPVGEVTEPAAITIEKYIGSSGSYKLYKEDGWEPVTGAAKFTITKKETNGSETPATLYVKDGDVYTTLNNNTVSIDPGDTLDSKAVSTTGSITLYMDPGTYVIKEVGMPQYTEKAKGDTQNGEDKEITVTAGGEVETAAFYNDEKLGSITVKKTGVDDGTSAPLGGAEFGLYENKECTGEPKETLPTDSKGTLTFDRLVPGNTYYVKEISAPLGYIKDETIYPVEITTENLTHTVKSTNYNNSAYVLLQKQYYNYTAGEFQDVNSSNYTVFNGAFEIQRKDETGNWGVAFVTEKKTDPETGQETEIDIPLTNLSLNSNGRGQRMLPVYDENNQLITYRIKETLPDGWHADGEKTEDGKLVYYTDEFNLQDKKGLGTDEAKEITIQNTRRGSFTLNKTFYYATRNGIQKAEKEEDTNFYLYQQVGEDGEIKLYSETPYTTKNGSLTVTDLPVGTAEEPIYYYWAEAERSDDYSPAQAAGGTEEAELSEIEITVLDDEGGTTTKKIQAYGPYNFLDKIGGTSGQAQLARTVNVSNIQQKVPVVVKKVSTADNAFVSGAKYTIYQLDDGGNRIETPVVQETEITDSNGSFQSLKPGYKYEVVETTTPKGYNNANKENELIIDLTNIDTVNTATETVEVTIKNDPDPAIQIDKKVKNADGTSSALTGITFEVYQKKGNEFVRAYDYDGNKLSITSGVSLRLPAGTYYFRETGENSSVLDPEKFISLYENDKDIEIETDGGKVYFGPFTVEDKDTVQKIAIENLSSEGAAQITKKVEGNAKEPSGAVFKIYRKNSDDNSVIELGSDGKALTVTTGSNGTAVFKNLPIYDENHKIYTYYIQEVTPPEGCTLNPVELELQLAPGEIVQKTTDGADLTVVNQTQISFTVNKVYYNIWENYFTEKQYSLPGTEIALYEKVEENGETYYRYVATQTTNSLGSCTFTGLDQDKEYAAIEVGIPNDAVYEHVEPIKGDYLPSPAPEIISSKDLENYNYVTKKANTSNIPQEDQDATLKNVEHWAQIRVEKYIYRDEEAEVEYEKEYINHSEFTLYQQVVAEEDGTELTFNPDNCTEIGSYSSGTYYIYNEDGERERVDGWLATDILQVDDNIVYWMVETDGGPAGKIKPENQIILFTRKDSPYKNNSTSIVDPETSCTRTENYEEDGITSFAWENDPPTGTGELRYATVRIAKWADSLVYDPASESYEPAGKYTPLGNAKFELWLTDENGQFLEKLDTLTTGLDNDVTDSTTDLTSWAASKSFNLDTLQKEYQKQYPDSFVQDDDVWYVRVAIREISAPLGYQTLESPYYMELCFAPATDGKSYSETFNDAYYITDKKEKVPLATDLDKEGSITWARVANDVNGKKIDSIPEQTDSYRLVDLPMDNYGVTVNKYGYTPGEETLNLTSQELDQILGGDSRNRTTLSGVEMRLERYVENSTGGEWTAWDYVNQKPYQKDGDGKDTFTTNEGGFFTFPGGLDIGEYRLIETKGNDSYENVYDGSSIGGGDGKHDIAAYYFQVKNHNVTVSMYNPSKLSMTVKKTDLKGNSVSGFEFTLTPAKGTGIKKSTDTNGIAEFTNLETGSYTLSEGSSNTYSTVYLKEYLEEAYGKTEATRGLTALAEGGLKLGYATALKSAGPEDPEEQTSDEADKDVVISSITDMSSYGINDNVTLTVKNPEKVSLTIQKTDEDETGLPGAKFTVEWQPFTAFTGTVDYTDSADSWTKVSRNNSTVFTSDGEGICAVKNLDPGIYRITETAAPDGYEKMTDPQIIAITGGMAVTVNGIDKDHTFAGTDGNPGKVTFVNRELVNLSVEKIIHGENVLKAQGFSEEDSTYTFDFYLYSDPEGKKQVGDKVSITVSYNGENLVIDNEKAVFENLSQGKTYYLKEVSSSEFSLTKVTQGDSEVVPSNNLYPVAIENGNTTVTAENTYLYAQVTLNKIDGETNQDLSGAEFDVYSVEQDGTPGETPLGRDRVTWNGYTATIRLSQAAEETFVIKEKTAPNGYVPTENTVTVSLKPGDQRLPADYEDLTVKNYQGAYIEINKYDNIHGSSSSLLQGEVSFAIYEQSADGTWLPFRDVSTQNGILSELVTGNHAYAIVETRAPGNYAGMESIYEVTGDKDTPVTMTGTAGDSTGRTVYILNQGAALQPGQTYKCNVYNRRYLNLEIRKKDVSDAGILPKADVSIYEVPDGLMPEQESRDALTREEINALIAQCGEAKTITTSELGDGYTYADEGTYPDILGKIEPGKNYLILETKVDAYDENSQYNTMILDDTRTVWYQFLTTEDGERKDQTVTLANVLGKASVKLDKTSASENNLTSLYTQGADLTYTLQADVDNTYALDSYVLKDTGLSVYNGDTLLGFKDYLSEKYSVTQVKVGTATHNVKNYGISNQDEAEVISAVVSFYGFNSDEDPIYTETVENLSTEHTVSLPASAGKAKYVEISYESKAFREATGYALGQDFKPGAVTVTVHMDTQSGGAETQEITKVQNDAEAVITYRIWNENGEQASAENRTSARDDDNAENKFAHQEAAVVSVEKTSSKTTGVDIGETIDYSIKISNSSDATAALENPIIVDLLPQGMTLDTGEKDYISITGDNPSKIEYGHYRTESRGDNTAVLVFLTGNLDIGDSVTLTMKVKVTEAVVNYPNNPSNYAFVTSDQRGTANVDNPAAASFKNSSGNWAQSFSTVGGQLLDGDRLAVFQELLGNQANYGYVADSQSITWNSNSQLTLVKSAYGDRDVAQNTENTSDDAYYSSTNLATVSNGEKGEAHFRLSMYSGVGDESQTNISLIDILPTEDDFVYSSSGVSGRYSHWNLTLSGPISVSKAGLDTTLDSLEENKDYVIYYYNQKLNGADDYANVYKMADTYTFGKRPENDSAWSTQCTENTAAFMILLSDQVVLGSGESLTVEYVMKVNNGQGLPEDEYAYYNAVNSFVAGYDWYKTADTTPNPQRSDYMAVSNSVSVTLQPQTSVSVGGQVWIDMNRNGTRDSGEDAQTLKEKYPLIRDLLDKIEISISEYTSTRENDGAVRTIKYDRGEDWNGVFQFDGLFSGALQNGVSDEEAYKAQTGKPYSLILSKMKGSNPYTYVIQATLPTGSDSVEGDFGLTSLGEETGKSRKPDELETFYSAETTDNNFYSESTAALSERFYLWPTTEVDTTKDIGLVLNRNLEITKVAEDDPETVIEGAKFKIYGPFAADTKITADNFDNLVKTLDQTKDLVGEEITTDENGKASIQGLNWFQKYVIVETQPGEGYELDGATAAGSSSIVSAVDGLKNTWILNVPSDDSTVVTENVTVTNIRSTTVDLEASKTMTGKNLDNNEFTFLLSKDQAGNEIVARAENTAEDTSNGTVTFKDVKLEGEGKHTFYIQESKGTEDGIHYDDTVYKVDVETEWREKVEADPEDPESEGTPAGLYVKGITYYVLDEEGNAVEIEPDKVQFQNEYYSAISWAPTATKELTGRNIKEGETFTFTVTDKKTGEVVSTGTAKGTGEGSTANVEFKDISYKLAKGETQTYVYVVEEDLPENEDGQDLTQKDGITYDNTKYEVNVTVKDKEDGTATVTPTYPAEMENGLTFTNHYDTEPVQYAPKVEKTLTGDKTANTKSFTFTLTPDHANPENGAVLPESLKLDVPVDKFDQEVTGSFGEIEFKKPGTYKFIIQEENKGSTADGITYSNISWTLEIQVEDDGVGSLVIPEDGVTYIPSETGDDIAENSEKASFTNTYEFQQVKQALSVKKIMEGDIPEERTFSFTLDTDATEEDGVIMPAHDPGTEVTAEVTIPKGAATADPAAFGEITFTKPGTFNFTIKENQPDPVPAGYSYSNEIWNVQVTVKDNNKGQLVVQSVTYTCSDTDRTDYAEFTNYYNTTETSYVPAVKKTFTGDTRPEAQELTFNLKEAEGNSNPEDGAWILTGEDEEQVKSPIPEAGIRHVETVSPSQNEKTFSLPGIIFTKAGTYTFDITEEKGNKNGYTYDSQKVWRLTVIVEDNDSKLTIDTVKNVTYTLIEDADEEAIGKTASQAEFTNSYATKPGDYTAKVSKVLSTDSDTPSESRKFTFTLTPDKDYQEAISYTESDMTVQAAPGETVSFGKITFNEAGDYVFDIKETKDGAGGYTYDDTQWQVRVKVTDQDSQLVAAGEYYKKAAGDTDYRLVDNAKEAAFVNQFAYTAVTFTPEVEKKIEGEENRPVEKVFSFTISQDPGDKYQVTLPAEKTTVTGPGTASFGTISFEQPGTYNFYIQEEKGNEAGYAYDKAKWKLTVEVTDEDHDGQLEVQGTTYYVKTGDRDSYELPETSEKKAVFTNTYTVTSTKEAPSVEKAFAGQERPEEKEFTFTLKLEEGYDNPEKGAVIQENGDSLKIKGADKKDFPEITFNRAGTYHFTISETKGSETGYTYDGRDWTWIVEVKDTDSVLSVVSQKYVQAETGTESEDCGKFTNDYIPETTTYSPAVEKRLAGETQIPEDKIFTFKIQDLSETEGAVIPKETVQVTGADTAQFQPITFTKAGTYNFLITEDQTSKHNGYGYDDNTWTLVVKVKDNNGKLELDGDPVYTPAEEADGIEENTEHAVFVNTYSVTSTSQTLSVVKEITGDETPADKDFYFELSGVSGTPEDGYKLPDNTEVKIIGKGNGTFDAITFTRAGDYTFQIRERDTKEPGYGYDQEPWTVKIHVEDQDSKLTVISVVYEKNGEAAEGADTATFTNTYTVKPTTFTPAVEKLLTGADTPADKTFYFTMEADRSNLKDGAQMGSREAQISGPGQTSFEPITFTQAGTYRFFITENQGSQEDYRGYTFDDTTWMLIVTVEDIDSQLTVKEEDTMYLRTDEETGEQVTDDMAVFTNDYQVEPVDYQLQASKTVTGDDRPSEETFRFNLTEIPEENEGAQLPQNTSIEITGSGESAFDAIHFTKAGTYRFEIREENTEKPGYHYDESTWTVTVEVTDHDSRLEVTDVTYAKNGEAVKDAQMAAFENVYDTETADYTPVVTKKLTGDERPVDQEKTFRFTIEAAEDNPEGAELSDTEAAVQGAGHTSFEPIRFTKAGTYRFIIRESAGEEKGYTYDSSEWTLTVKVEDLDSILTVTESIYQKEGEEKLGEAAGKAPEEDINGDNSSVQEPGAIFTNDYQVTETTWQPQVEKKVTGDMPENETFRFTLAAGRENPEGIHLPENLTAEAEVDKDTGTSGKVAFDEITFTKAGTYQFQITEENTGKAGYTYDGNIWTVTVKIADEDSFLTVADVTYAKAGQVAEKAENAVFENIYETRAAAFTPTVKKTITGDKAPDEKVFWFTLEANENNPEGAELQTTETSVKGEGTASFGNITFTKAGTYKFYLREKDGGEKGYTYDTSRWMLTVTVKDKDSILTVEKAAYTKVGELFSNTEAATFQNKYTAEKTTGTKINTTNITNTTKTTEKTTTTKTTTTRRVKTGDTSNALLWFALMSASALTGAGVVNRRRRKKRR